ncbi:hypothetical protein BsWGS_29181 [Bradybaena similaris]
MARVWEINERWSRIKFFNFDTNPTTRHTFWNLVIGSAMGWVGAYGIGQASVQRYSSLPTLNNARLSVLLNMLGLIILVTTTCMAGIVLFAYYAAQDCDPLGLDLVDNSNQLVPYFVMETLRYPGVPGLFVASLFSGALSSVSSSLSALSAITWEDILKPHFDKGWSEHKKTVCTKLLVIGYGCLGVGVAFVAEKLEGTVLQAAVTFLGGIGGPLTGMFTLGAFFPWANSYGAMTGAVCGLGMSMWLSIGSYVEGIPKLQLPYPNGTCYPESNVSLTVLTTVITMTTQMTDTTTITESGDGSVLKNFYKISYMWFTPISITTVVIVGLVVSFITGANSIHDVPTKYQIPLLTRILCCLPDSVLYKLNCCRHFQDPEVIRADEKNVEIVIPAPDSECSVPVEKLGVDNKAYNNSNEYQGGRALQEFSPPSYTEYVQGQGDWYSYTNGPTQETVSDSSRHLRERFIVERF